MLSIYPACFYKEIDGKYSVIFPDLNYLATYGENLEDAMAMAVDVLAGFLYACRRNGEALPTPSALSEIDPASISRKIASDEPIGEALVNLISVDADAYAKKHFEKSVKKTLTIPAWLNDAALEKNLNFSKILKEALIAKLNA